MPSGFPPSTLSSASARSFGAIPGYAGHSIHGLQSPLADNHIQNIAAQPPYKTVAQALTDPYAGLRLTSQTSNSLLSKPLFTQDAGIKDVSYASSVSHSPTLDMSQKHWNLSNYVSQSPFGLLPADLSASDFLTSPVSSQPSPAPPPAHSSKHSSSFQRTGFPLDDLFSGRTAAKSPLQRPSPYEYRDSISAQSDLAASQGNNLFSFSQNLGFAVKSEPPPFTPAEMSYEAVSPATPGDTQHNAGSDSYHVSLQDLASISSTQEKLEVHNAMQKPQTPIMQDTKKLDKRSRPQSVVPMQQDMYTTATPNGQLSQMKPSPAQQSPASVGGSPQNHMPLGSPQTPIPSSTYVTAPPAVQAPADSTTKPKRPRGRKKKDPIPEPKKEVMSPYPESVVQYNQQMMNPAVRDQAFSNSPDLSQRNNGNEYHPSYNMQNSRTPQPTYSSSTIDNVQTNSPLMTSSVIGSKASVIDINQYNKGPIQSHQQFKSEPSPIMTQPSPVSVHQMSPMAAPQQSPMTAPQQSPLAGPQQSPMMVRFQSPSPMPPQGGAPYSVSDALEMNREAMFTNQPIVDGYSAPEINSYSIQESFTSQLGMPRPGQYSSQEEAYSSQYGGQFVSPNNVLAVEMNEGPTGGSTSTIDEGAFASLMDESYDQQRYIKQEYGHNPYANFPLTVDIKPENDEEFCHLAQAPKDTKVDLSKVVVKTENNMLDCVPPPRTPRLAIRSAAGGSSFMESYLNFLQGKKTETLSSMSSAIIHSKPQLPKYIPEPRRPRPVEVPKDIDTDSRSETGSVSQNSMMTFSDDESALDKSKVQINSAVKSAISSLEEVSNDNVSISTNKSGGLTMKINLAKVKSAEADARKAKAAKAKRSPGKSKKKGKGKGENYGYRGKYSSGEEEDKKEDEPAQQKIIPQRELSSRKAKEKRGMVYVNSQKFRTLLFFNEILVFATFRTEIH